MPMKRLHSAFVATMPGVFVVLWSTGFIGAKFGLPYAEPFTFLSLRILLVIALLAGVAVVMRAPWPNDRRMIGHLAVSGLLVHAVYLGGVFAAIQAGLPSGLTALLVGLQPLLTAVVAGRLLGEQVTRRQWVGLALGLAGVAMVLSTRLTALDFSALPWRGLGFALAALLGMTAGTLYQKRFCTGMDLRTGSVVQYLAAAAILLPAAVLTETMRVEWTGSFIFALGWLVLVLSVGAISLLMTLIRVGEAARVASLFYLVPPVTALMAWALFDERLGLVGLAGMVLAAGGVALVVSRR